MQIAKAADEVKAKEGELERNKGEAALTIEEKETIKALARVEAIKKLKVEYTLKDFLVQNEWTEEMIADAQTSIDKTVYNHATVEEIANIIVTIEDPSDAIDRVRTLIRNAVTIAKLADIKARYATMVRNYNETLTALINETL